FNQNRSQLAANRDTAHASLLGGQGAGVISNNGGGLLSDQGLGLISNNGGSVISNNGSGYRLLAATPLPSLPPGATIVTSALPGETLAQRRVFPDGMVALAFVHKNAVDPLAFRLVDVRDGLPFYELDRETLENWPNGLPHFTRTVTKNLFGGGLSAQTGIKSENADTGTPLHVSVLPDSFLRDAVGGAGNLIDSLELDLAAHTGTFRYVFPPLNAVETGTLANVKFTPNGQVVIPFWEPLGSYEGEETTTVGDQPVFSRKVAVLDGKPTFTYDLLDGLVMTLTASAADGRQLEGSVAQDGKQVGKVTLAVAPEGTAVYTVVLDEDPGHPLVVGYGAKGATPSAPPLPPLEASVVTKVGLKGKGFADGPELTARFQSAVGLVASRKIPGKFYAVDMENHRVRVVDQVAQTVSTLAGTGTAGYLDGPGSSARFNYPRALAVGPDDTLYVAEPANNRIRMVAPDGTVTTLAGSGTQGEADGPGNLAKFNQPVGLALDAAGTLYVADLLGATIRKVATAGDQKGVVTTLAGPPNLKQPIGLALGPDGFLYVADFGGDRVRKVDLVDAAHAVTTIAGTDDPARKGMDGAALETGLEGPNALAFDASGRLLIANPSSVRRLEADGQLHTLAGTGLSLSQDGLARYASFTAINTICVASDGTLVIGDGALVRAVVPTGR
ncbi:MAG: hypothetical protein JWM80_6315, partial [Cyanobacteria bacterium RYN_339]|nr:hypothetical protein [Cyanobacteria bacterium RYN_339]